MIIWIASYPKSGNTWVRSFLVSLLYNKKNETNLEGLNNIPQYPLRSHFNNLLDNIDDINEVSSKWIISQKRINLDKKNKFFKTHHALCKIGKFSFTNYETSLGAIHIVRDPRNIINSILYHYSKKSFLEAKEFMLDETRALGKKFDPNLHQAMTELEDDKSEAGSVVQEIQPGYMLGQRLLRPALVSVAKKKSAKSTEKTEKKG